MRVLRVGICGILRISSAVHLIFLSRQFVWSIVFVIIFPTSPLVCSRSCWSSARFCFFSVNEFGHTNRRKKRFVNELLFRKIWGTKGKKRTQLWNYMICLVHDQCNCHRSGWHPYWSKTLLAITTMGAQTSSFNPAKEQRATVQVSV